MESINQFGLLLKVNQKIENVMDFGKMVVAHMELDANSVIQKFDGKILQF